MKSTDEPVVVEQTYNATTEAVWSAITELDQMRQWYFDNIPSFEPEVGFETQFTVKSGEREFPHRWKVTEVVPHQKLVYNWRYDSYPGDSYVAFELSQEESATKIRLTATVVESFPDEIPEFRRENCVLGWEYFIKQNLKEFLEKSE